MTTTHPVDADGKTPIQGGALPRVHTHDYDYCKPASGVEVQTDQNGEYQSRGVQRIEAVVKASRSNKKSLWLVAISVIICAWATSTTSSYSVWATSDYESHSDGLGALSIATSLVGAVAKPFIAKIADITSRPDTYIVTLTFYVVGFIVVAASHTLTGYIVGEALVAVGSAGLDLLNDVIVADITPLAWRGFISSLLASPFIINTWFAGEITQALSSGNRWRWGYGMFAIIMPVTLGPAIVTLMWLDRRARKEGLVNLASSNAARRAAGVYDQETQIEGPRGAYDFKASQSQESWLIAARRHAIEMDAFGLLLLGFGWSLLLLPFSLRTGADGGWRNPSLIAMMVVGGLLLVAYVIFENSRFCPIPSSPKRLLLNRTFIMGVIIDSTYFIAGNMRSLYLSSYTWIIKDWETRQWTYFLNTLTLSLCVFGLVAGLLQRWTHRYKLLQVVGLSIKIVGMGLLLSPAANKSTAGLVMNQLLVGCGGALSVVGTRVATQASVPHQDVATVIALLSLWSRIGSSIGSAIASAIWGAKMPGVLRDHLPAEVPDAQVTKYFKNIRLIRELPIGSPTRQGAINAYQQVTQRYLWTPAFGIAFIPLIAAFFQTNFLLDYRQNAVDNKGTDGEILSAEPLQAEKKAYPPGWKGSLLRFWDGKA